MNFPPKVSISIPTYNHEKYIGQAIDSVLSQVTDFAYKLYVGEDCSLDRTREICIEYKKNNPDKIELLLNDKNDFNLNSRKIHNACFSSGSDYIAMLDGDDYWADPGKLQRQVDYLDANSDCAISFHNVWAIYDDGEKEEYCTESQKEKSYLADILKGNFIPSCSVLFRNGLFEKLPDWFFSVTDRDRILHCLNAEHGYIKYFPEIMAAYRIHGNGVWQKKVPMAQHTETIKGYEILNKHLGYRFDKIIKKEISNRYSSIAVEYYREGKIKHARSTMTKSFRENPMRIVGLLISWAQLKFVLMLLFPQIYKFLRRQARKSTGS